MAVILGIDPGSRITGFGVVSLNRNQAYYIASGCIRTKSLAFPERLQEIFQGISGLIECHAPECVAIEQVFMAKNADSALKLGHARGAAIVAAVNNGLPVAEYSARQIKRAVVGKGNADKKQVQHMVVELLKLKGVPQTDAADALATALCHCFNYAGYHRFSHV